VVLEEERVQLVNRFLNRLRLFDNIYTVRILFQHAHNRAHVALDGTRTIEQLGFVGGCHSRFFQR
jgi:hypothetical protein